MSCALNEQSESNFNSITPNSWAVLSVKWKEAWLFCVPVSISSHDAWTCSKFPESKLPQAEAGLPAPWRSLQGPPVPYISPVAVLQEGTPTEADLEEAEGEWCWSPQRSAAHLFLLCLCLVMSKAWNSRSYFHQIVLIKALSIIREKSCRESGDCANKWWRITLFVSACLSLGNSKCI